MLPDIDTLQAFAGLATECYGDMLEGVFGLSEDDDRTLDLEEEALISLRITNKPEELDFLSNFRLAAAKVKTANEVESLEVTDREELK